MKKRLKAYALIEMLIILGALAVIMALSVKPMRMFLSEIPKADRNYQTWVHTMDMLQRLKEDVENSEGLEMEEDAAEDAGARLKLETPEGSVTYVLADEHVVRESAEAGKSRSEWKLPASKVRLNVWKRESVPYAVEIATWTQNKDMKAHRNFAQTYVFFRGRYEE